LKTKQTDYLFLHSKACLMKNIRCVVFDWGDTIMRDFPDLPGPMCSWTHVEYVPGAEDVLAFLHASRRKMVIATNAGASDTDHMIKALRRVGADQYFHHFFSSKDLRYEKPEARFFRSISNTMMLKPEECVMIGNSYEKDIVGAKNSGMFTIFFNENDLPGDFPMADYIITDLLELFSIFQKK